MRKILITVCTVFVVLFSYSQDRASAESMVKQGIALHDKGDYEGAIALYDKAIDLDKEYFLPWYEKTFSLFEWGKKKECIALSKEAIKKFPGDPGLKHIYVQYGSSLDDLGKPKDAIEIYDKGIALFPGEFLLHFNKGLTLQKMDKAEEALAEYKKSLQLKPLHSSSNLYTGFLLQSSNKIPSLLAYATFLAIESRSERSGEAMKRVEKILWGNTKTEGNNTTIFLDAALLGNGKDKSKEDNFSPVEMIFMITAGSKELDSLGKTAAGKLSLRLQMLINLLTEQKKSNKGFYWDHYVPFFTEMKEKEMVETLAHLMYMKTGDEENMKWLEDNEAKLEAFYDWLKAYKWTSR